jgi:hypothetical protein
MTRHNHTQADSLRQLRARAAYPISTHRLSTYTSMFRSLSPTKRLTVRPGLYTAHHLSSPWLLSGTIAMTDVMFFALTIARSPSPPCVHKR